MGVDRDEGSAVKGNTDHGPAHEMTPPCAVPWQRRDGRPTQLTPPTSILNIPSVVLGSRSLPFQDDLTTLPVGIFSGLTSLVDM